MFKSTLKNSDSDEDKNIETALGEFLWVWVRENNDEKKIKKN